MQLFRRTQPPDDTDQRIVAFDPALNREVDRANRDYQSDKLAALEAEIERMAQLQRLGYDFEITTRQDSDRGAD